MIQQAAGGAGEMTNQDGNSEFILHLTNARMDKKDAIEHLEDTYTSQVREYITTHKEDDLEASVEKVFITAFEQLQTFRGDSAEFAAYLYKIIHQEITLDLLDMSDFITAEHHKALSLNIFFGLSYEQIAKMSNSTSSHVQNLATQATQQLINQQNRTSATSDIQDASTLSDEIPEPEETDSEISLSDSVAERTTDDTQVGTEPDNSDHVFDDVALTQDVDTEIPTEINTSFLAESSPPEPETTAETLQVAPPEEEEKSKKKFLLLLSALTLMVIAGAAVAYIVWNQNYRTTATGVPETTSAPSTSLTPETTQPPTTSKRTTITETSLVSETKKPIATSPITKKPTTTLKPTTTRKPTTTVEPTTSITATTITPVRPVVAPPQSCEVQLWDDDFSAGVEVLEPTQNFRPNYIFYNSQMQEVRQTKDLRPPQRDDPQELEWIAATNGFRTKQVFYVAASDGTNASSPVLCQRVSR